MTGDTLVVVAAYLLVVLAACTLVALVARWRTTALVLGALLLLDLAAGLITSAVTR